MKKNIIIKFLFFLVLTTFVLAKDYTLNVTEELSFGNVECGLSCFLSDKNPTITATVQIVNNSANNTQLYMQLPNSIELTSTNNLTKAVINNIQVQSVAFANGLYTIPIGTTQVTITGTLTYNSTSNYSGLFEGTIVAELNDASTTIDTTNIRVSMQMQQTKLFTETQPLSFGTVIPSKESTCSITINPNGAYTHNGCEQVSGAITQGVITTYTDVVANNFTLSFPSSVNLVNATDNSYLILNNFTYTQIGSAISSQSIDINVGATLIINATSNNYSGDYSGSIPITINY